MLVTCPEVPVLDLRLGLEESTEESLMGLWGNLLTLSLESMRRYYMRHCLFAYQLTIKLGILVFFRLVQSFHKEGVLAAPHSI